jgi:type 1 glutamine amidotransferase
MIAEDEYKTEETLPQFASDQLGKDFRVSYVFGSDSERNEIPGLAAIDEADVLLVSVRRRVLPADDITRLKKFAAAGKPIIGIRTASHAFSIRDKSPPAHLAAWPEFDAQVFGGNYHGHHSNKVATQVRLAKNAKQSPGQAILGGLAAATFESNGSLYKVSPLASAAMPLLAGRIEGQPEEPVAWTFERADGGRSFYTSLGHADDFENETFVRLLANGIYWAAELPVPKQPPTSASQQASQNDWQLVEVPSGKPAQTNKSSHNTVWYRCAVRIPSAWSTEPIWFTAPNDAKHVGVWLDGTPLTSAENDRFAIPASAARSADAHLFVVRLEGSAADRGLVGAPHIVCGKQTMQLAGYWQSRVGDDPTWSNLQLPAKFGASTDILFQP